jgi:hypothetical protein
MPCHSRESRKLKIVGLKSRLAWTKNKTLFSKIIRAKRAKGTAQAAQSP